MPTTNFSCHGRRHMPAFAFVVYDAMLAMAKSDKKREPGAPLECFARLATIQNHCDLGQDAVRRAIKWLVANGWLRPMTQLGSHGANRYRVLEHAEYVSNFPNNCPTIRFDPETGRPIGQDSEMSLAFFLQRLRQLAGGVFRYDFASDDGGWTWRLRKSEGQPGTDAGLRKGQPGTDAGLR